MDLTRLLEQSKQDLPRLFGDNLVSLLVFGSAAIGDFVSQHSDVNLLVVLKSIELDTLNTLHTYWQRMKKHRLGAPLVMTKDYISSSADVFPVEFLEIQEKHQLLYGEDIFVGLEISLQNLRHECEHEMKGRILRLRQSYLETNGRPPVFRPLLVAAHQANLPAFRTALRLKNLQPPVKKDDVLAKLSQAYGLKPEVFERLKTLSLRTTRWQPADLRKLFEDYLHEMEKLAAAIDRL